MSNLKIIRQNKIQRLEDIITINGPLEKIEIPETLYCEKAEELSEIGLERIIAIDKLDKIFIDAQDSAKVRQFWGESGNDTKPRAWQTDGYLGVHLHNYLRLSQSEASRPELWNSIVAQSAEARKYISYRDGVSEEEDGEVKSASEIEGDVANILKVLFVQNRGAIHQNHYLSGSWWIVEMTRNGKDYETSKNAFRCTTYFTRRWYLLDFMHNRILAVSISNYFSEWNEKGMNRWDQGDDVKPGNARTILATNKLGNPQFSNTIKDHLISSNIETKFKPLKINHEKFIEWQKKRPTTTLKGPDDFNISKSMLKVATAMIDELGETRGWKKI